MPVVKLFLSTRALWYWLFAIVVCYNFHRYIFKYSHGAFAKNGYEQTPFIWQVGKYLLVATILGIIYLKSRFTTRIPVKLLLFYSFISYVLLINIGSVLLYHEVMTDEWEYVVFSLTVLPLGFVVKDDLQLLANEINSILNVSQYVLIVSNWIVIFNYYAFDIVPFHAFKGVLMRYGGLWEDPNAFAIISVLLAGYALTRKQYLTVAIHISNVLLTISLNGYLLLLAFASYWLLNNPKRRILHLTLFIVLLGIIGILIVFNLEYITQIYEAKQESIDQHASLATLSFNWIPLLQPIQFHETWFVSVNINYFPFSALFTIAMVIIFVRFFFFRDRSIQRLMFILFFVTSLFLPFLYMFPVNFIALLFLVLYTKGVQF